MLDAQYAPLEYDVLVTDVHTQDLHGEISRRLGSPYLHSSDDDSPVDSVNGIIWGPNNRVFVSMKVRIRNRPAKNVHMLVDTGSPQTYLCQEVFKASNAEMANTRDAVNATVNGTRLSILQSPEGSHFSDINVLGCDYFRIANATLNVSFSENSVSIYTLL